MLSVNDSDQGRRSWVEVVECDGVALLYGMNNEYDKHMKHTAFCLSYSEAGVNSRIANYNVNRRVISKLSQCAMQTIE